MFSRKTIDNSIVAHLFLQVEDVFNTPSFYFSHTLDLTNSQQKLDGLIENDAKGYFVLDTASPSFTWNCKTKPSNMLQKR